MRVLADSHAIFWFVIDPDKLGDAASKTLAEAEQSEGIAISAITYVDLWYVTQKDGIALADYEAMLAVVEDPRSNIEVLSVVSSTGRNATFASRGELPDPFDRLIVATALEHGLPLVTKDERIASLGVATVVW